MLDELVNGKEQSRFIVLHDTVHHRGDCLLKYITQGLLNRFNAVIAFLFDEQPRNFKSELNNQHRLFCHDGFSDPLNWNKDKCSSPESLNTPFYLKTTLDKVNESEESLKKLSDKPAKLGIIINSLSSLLAHQDISLVSQDVFEAMHWKTPACEVIQTVALVHCDLHDDNILASFNYQASTIIELQKRTRNPKEDADGYFNITHRKKSGKIQRKKECYKIENNSKIKIVPAKSEEKNEQSKLVASETSDVTSDLTFNLSLTEQQKEARSNLQLPYILNEKIKKTQLELGKKSQIFYQADDADDIDEEDPDDDLNI